LIYLVIAYINYRWAQRWYRLALYELGHPVCAACGYLLVGTADSRRCPECGWRKTRRDDPPQVHWTESDREALLLEGYIVCNECGGLLSMKDATCARCGAKLSLAVDTLGLVLAVVVHGADWQDYDGACFVMMRLKESFRRLKVVFADSAYGRNGLPAWVQSTCGWILQTVLRPVGVKGFVVLPKRWVVERTFAWLSRWRRHSKDYERNPETSEAMIYITMIHLMSRRLATQNGI
jgi:transposase